MSPDAADGRQSRALRALPGAGRAAPTNAKLSQLLFTLVALAPAVRPRMLIAVRRQRTQKIQKQRGSRVIVLIRRQESLAFSRITIVRWITREDSEEMLLRHPARRHADRLAAPHAMRAYARQPARMHTLRDRPAKLTAVALRPTVTAALNGTRLPAPVR